MPLFKKSKKRKEKKAKRKEKKVIRKGKRAVKKTKRVERRKKRGSLGMKLAFPLLIPFKAIMLTMLHKKGVPVPDRRISKVAESFYKHIALGRNYEGLDFETNFEELAESNYEGYAVAVGTIIKTIVSFFKGLKKKKDSGQPLSNDEEKALEVAEKIGEDIEEIEKDEVEEGIGEKILEYWWIGAIAIVGILYLTRKK